MTTLELYLYQVAVFAIVPFYMATTRPNIRTTAFYVYIGIILFLGGFIGFLISFPLTEEISISGGSVAYAALFMAAILLVVIDNSINVLRQVIRLVITVNVFKTLFFYTFAIALGNNETINIFATDPRIFETSWILTIQGGVLIILELLLLVFLFGKIKHVVVHPVLLAISYTLCFALVLCLDGILFPLLTFTNDPDVMNYIVGGLTSKAILAISFGPFMLAFMLIFHKQVKHFSEEPISLSNLLLFSKEQLAEEITKQRQSLDKKEKMHRVLLKSIGDVYFTLDSEMRITHWNERASSDWGHTEQEVLGKRFIDVFPEKKASAELNYYQSALNDKQNSTFETSYNLNDEQHTYDVSVFQNEDGISVIARNITSKLQTERKQRELQKLESLGTLAGGIAHDFNNILGVIRAYTELSLMKLTSDKALKPYLDNIHKATDKAIGLVKQILSFSRMDDSHFEAINPIPVIDEALTMIRAVISAKIDINFDHPANCGLIKGDKTQLNQVFLNIVTNAYHAMENTGGKLDVIVATEYFEPKVDNIEPHDEKIQNHNYLKITIKDNGIGMSKDVLKNIFDPFFTTKESGKGTGLGLSVVHGIVAKHKGEIIVDSTLGEGTIFNLYFPLTKAEETSIGVDSSKSMMKSGSGHIMLVEDDNSAREAYQLLLEPLGYTVTMCRDGASALAEFHKNPEKFDLIFTDFDMPNVNGEELAAEIHQSRPELPIILASGNLHLLSNEEAENIGVVEFLSKPFSLKTLSKSIEKHITKVVD